METLKLQDSSRYTAKKRKGGRQGVKIGGGSIESGEEIPGIDVSTVRHAEDSSVSAASSGDFERDSNPLASSARAPPIYRSGVPGDHPGQPGAGRQ